MKNILDKLASLLKKYKSYVSVLVGNMRLVLLIMFSILSAYLVFRVDSLLNKDVAVQTDTATASSLSKSPDKEVLSIFNELEAQSVSLNSEFVDNRVNPF
jgi:hypothetical protein